MPCVSRTYVFTPHSIRPPDLGDELCGVESDFNNVVEQSEGWCQREGGHEQRHEAVLYYCAETPDIRQKETLDHDIL